MLKSQINFCKNQLIELMKSKNKRSKHVTRVKYIKIIIHYEFNLCLHGSVLMSDSSKLNES